MADQALDAAVEARLRAFLAAELRQAELDYPRIALPRTSARRRRRSFALGVLAIVALAAAVAIGRWAGPLPTTGGDPLGADGFPLTIGGQPVLRGAAIDARLGSDAGNSDFLAGGYLVLHPAACGSASPAPSGGCTEDWRLDDASAGTVTTSYPLLTIAGGSTFVRTTGAPTVFRVKGTSDLFLRSTNADQRHTLEIEAVLWRQPTKGGVPTEASPPQGGPINMALVPDFVSVVGGGETIVGYAPKELLLNPRPAVGGSPGSPAPEIPVPVYGEDLTTLAGHMVAGHGFVPLGSSVPSGAANLGSPSVAPSASPPTSGDTVDGFKLGVIAFCSPGVGEDAAALDRGCLGYAKRATAALDDREPGHAAIVGQKMYSDGTQPEPVDYSANAPSPTPAPTAHPGPRVTVFVFTLADGSIRATGVACTGNGPSASCIGVGSYPN